MPQHKVEVFQPTVIALLPDVADAVVPRRIFPANSLGVISGSVVGNEELKISVILREQRIQRPWQESLSVVYGQPDIHQRLLSSRH